MNYSCWVRCWPLFLLAFCATGRADIVTLFNGSSNLAYTASLAWGSVNVPPGTRGDVYANPGDFVTNSVQGTNVNYWLAVAGHDYRATCSTTGQVQIDDSSPQQTFWFWSGFVMIFAMGLFAWAATWTRRVIGGGEVN